MKKMSLKRMLEAAETNTTVLDRVPKSFGREENSSQLLERVYVTESAEFKESPATIVEINGAEDLKLALKRLESSRDRNAQLREEHGDSPSEFLDSEVELDERIKQLHGLVVCPELFPLFDELQGFVQLIQLLSHINDDIGVEVVRLLIDVTDADVLEQVERPDNFLNALMKADISTALVSMINRLSDSSNVPSAESINSCLELVSNLVKGLPELMLEFFKANLANVLLHVISTEHTDFFEDWLYAQSFALEILFDMVQTLPQSIEVINDSEVLLDELRKYSKNSVVKASPYYKERRENLVDVVVVCLNNAKNKPLNHLPLFVSLLRSKDRDNIKAGLRLCSLVVADAQECNEFVNLLGLRVIGPLLSNKLMLTKDDEEFCIVWEYILCIVYSLLLHCDDSHRARVVSKIAEGNMEKLVQLLGICSRDIDRVDPSISRTGTREDQWLARCGVGLIRVQKCCLVLLLFFRYCDTNQRQQIVELVENNGVDPRKLIQIVSEYIQLVPVDSFEGDTLRNCLVEFQK